MIGSALKKLAQENGMEVAKGMGFGTFRGYAMSMCEGSGYKLFVFSTRLPDQQSKDALFAQLDSVDLKRVYRVEALNLDQRCILVRFLDNPGTIKKINEFLDWFIPVLNSIGATKADICVDCGCAMTEGRWVMVNGITYYVHESCAQKIQREIEAENTQRKEADNGSYITGTIGAFLGAVLGAILWALALNMGYVASIVGLAIGWLANKGYDLLKGKQGKGKIVVLAVAVIIGVLLGTVASEVITLAGMISNGEMPGLVMADLVPFLLFLIQEEAEYRTAVLSNAGMGLLFAALGAFALLKKTGQEVSGAKFEYLK